MMNYLNLVKRTIILTVFLISLNSYGQPQRTNLPTLYITTTGGQEIVSKDVYLPGNLTIVASPGTPGLYSGPIEIRGRGNATWNFPKKPYKIKLGTKTNLLGMPSNETKWVLLANYKDNTLIRNNIAFEIGNYLGFAYTPAYRLVDVYLNGTFIGNYTLTDQVEKGNNRVTLDKLDNTMTTEPNLTGGYLVQAEIYADDEPNHFRTNQGMACSVKYPDEDGINSQQFDYIKNYVKTYEDKLFSTQSLDPTTGYNPVNDRDSQVKWFISCELTGNPDSFLSIYMYKQRNNPKIYFGPMWDYDGGFNNYNVTLGDATYKRMSSEANGTDFPKQMLKDVDFKNAVKTKWNQLKAAGLESNLDAKIVQLAQNIALSQTENKAVWGYDNPTGQANYNSKPYSDFVSELRTYMKNRIAYLDQQFNDEIREDMFYKLANRNTGKVIDINNTTDLMAVQNSASASALSQQWLFTKVDVAGTAYYKIQNRLTTKFLTSLNNSDSQLKLASGNNTDSQLWKPQGTDNDAYFGFVSKSSNRAIENQNNSSSDGNPIFQKSADINGSRQQQFTFIPFEVSAGPLPVTIIALSAAAEDSEIKLSWQVTESINGEKFVIQRSPDPSKIQPDSIGQVYLRESANGNYEFKDSSPKPGLSYYRLKILDVDGSTDYSKYVRANNPVLRNINVFPVPAAGTANISFTSQAEVSNSTVDLFNQTGRKVMSMAVQVMKGNNQYKFNTKAYGTGLYELRFSVDNQVATKKLVIISE